MAAKLGWRIFLRSLLVQSSWNFAGLQNLGFFFMTWPALTRRRLTAPELARAGLPAPGQFQHAPLLRGPRGGDRDPERGERRDRRSGRGSQALADVRPRCRRRRVLLGHPAPLRRRGRLAGGARGGRLGAPAHARGLQCSALQRPGVGNPGRAWRGGRGRRDAPATAAVPCATGARCGNRDPRRISRGSGGFRSDLGAAARPRTGLGRGGRLRVPAASGDPEPGTRPGSVAGLPLRPGGCLPGSCWWWARHDPQGTADREQTRAARARRQPPGEDGVRLQIPDHRREIRRQRQRQEHHGVDAAGGREGPHGDGDRRRRGRGCGARCRRGADPQTASTRISRQWRTRRSASSASASRPG